jgi:hypothetical protein
MWRHSWFKILVVLQLVNFAAMVLLEQQRRTIWDKEATNAQKILDIKQFSEKTEADLRYVARQLEILRERVGLIQTETIKNAADTGLQFKDFRDRLSSLHNATLQNTTDTLAQFTDFRERFAALQNDALKNAQNAGLIKDVRERVLHIEAMLQKLQPEK